MSPFPVISTEPNSTLTSKQGEARLIKSSYCSFSSRFSPNISIFPAAEPIRLAPNVLITQPSLSLAQSISERVTAALSKRVRDRLSLGERDWSNRLRLSLLSGLVPL